MIAIPCPLEQLAEGEVRERADNEIRVAEIEIASDCVRSRNADDACFLRGANAVWRVLDCDRFVRLDTERLERSQVEIRPRLRDLAVALRAVEGVPALSDCEAFEHARDPIARRTRDDRDLEAVRVRGSDVFGDSRTQRLELDELEMPTSNRLAYRLRIEPPSGEQFQLADRIVPTDGPDRRRPVAQQELMAVLLEGLAPRPKRGTFRIDDGAVEIEEERSNRHRSECTGGVFSPGH